MKLYITESVNTEHLINECLFFEYVNSDYDYDLTSLLVELLTTKSPIKLDSEYINDKYDFDKATEQNIKQWTNDPIFAELKSDMYDFATVIADELEQLPEVESVVVKSSKSVGLSTYITVHFKKPTKNDPFIRQNIKKDKGFLGHYLSGFGEDGGYEGEYTLKFRLSNHPVKYATDAGVEVDILGKVYNEFKDEVVNKCKKHIQSLDNYLKDFARTGKVSPKQIKRNQERNARKDKYNGKTNEVLQQLITSNYLKESYGTEALESYLDPDTVEVLHRFHINLEDVVDAIQVYFRELPMVFAQLIRIASNCINAEPNSYIYDDTKFDLQAFLNDMESYIIKNYPKYFM